MTKSRRLSFRTQHPLVNVLLVIGYVVFIVFAHEWFVNLSVQVMNSLSLEVYNRLVATIIGLGLASVLALIGWAIRSKTQVQRSGIPFLVFSVLGLTAHFFLFTEMNIEFIHAMEFGLLATLIYPLVGRFGAAAVCAFPVMLFDEWYQYQVLFDYVEYFDFNDILLDLLGAGLFLSVLRTFGRKTPVNDRPLFQRWEFYALVLMACVMGVLLATSIIVPYPDNSVSTTWLVLNAISEPYGFWRVHPLIGSTYHVLEPIPGLLTVFSVCFFYFAMDARSSEK